MSPMSSQPPPKLERDRQDGVLLEGIYPNGERAFAGVAVP